MVKSIRWRLQIWYTAILLISLVGFGGVMYEEARGGKFHRIDLELTSAANSLDAALRSFPAHELENGPPRDYPPREGPPPGRERGGAGPPGHPEPPPLGGRPPPRLPPDRQNVGEQRLGPPPAPGGRRTRGELLSSLDLRGQLYEALPGQLQDLPYFYIWRSNGSLLKSDVSTAAELPDVPPAFQSGLFSQATFVRRGRFREVFAMGPRATLILVGKSMAREIGDLRAFAWTLLFAGAAALAVGLVGGWLISARVLRPIAAISRTASSISVNSLSRRIDTGATDRELIDLAQVLNGMFDRLESSFERHRQFTADASHELRTPLTILYTNLELAISRPRTEVEYRETLESSFRAAGRMRNLVESLLVLARADAGRLDVQLAPCDLRGIADDAVAQHAPIAEEAGISLSTVPSSTPIWAMGDATCLARVASNLISNAIRHTPGGGSVCVSAATKGNRAVLIVTDTGCGIPFEDQPRIFERFYRVDAARSRSSGGNGLGLAICKSLVEAQQGTISFTSRPGNGTTFFVSLPTSHQERKELPAGDGTGS